MTTAVRTDTDEIGFPWRFQPPVTRVYLTPRARLRRSRNRLMSSLFVHDVKTAYAATFWWRCLVAALFVAGFLLATRHTFLDWSGAHSILTGGH